MLKNFLHDLFAALADAWKELIDVELPARWNFSGSGQSSHLVCGAFPLLGWLLGLLPLILGGLTGWLFNRSAGVLIFVFSAWIISYFKDSGKCDDTLCRALLRRLGREDEPLPVLRIVAAALRFGMLTVIALNGKMALFPLILAGTFGMQAELAASPFNPGPLLPVEGRRFMRIVMIAALVLALPFCRLSAVVLALLFILMLRCFTDKLKDNFTAEAITAAGNFTEWLLLFAAMLTA